MINVKKFINFLLLVLFVGNSGVFAECFRPTANFARHSGKIYVYFSPDGKLVTSGGTKPFKLWDTETGKISKELEGKEKASAIVAFNKDGSLVAAGTDDGITQVWNVKSGALLYALKGNYGEVSIIAFSPDGKSIAVAGNSKSGILGQWSTPRAKVWNLETGKEIFSFIYRKYELYTEYLVSPKIIFSPDGKTIIASFGDDITIWDAGNGKQLAELFDRNLTGKFGETSVGGAVRNLKLSPDGKYLVTTPAINGTPRIWNLSTGELHFNLGRYAESADFSPNGKLLALGGNGSDVRVFEMSSLKELTLKGHKKTVMKVSYSPDGKYLASSDSQLDNNETTTIIWDASTWKPIQFLYRQRYAEFSPNGQILATIDEKNRFQLWNVNCK